MMSSREKLSDQAPVVFYCPFCRVVSGNMNNFQPTFKNHRWVYKCNSRRCGRTFYQYTYKIEQFNGEQYSTKDKEMNVNTLIANIIIEQYKELRSYRKVAEMTHFSRRRVGKEIKKRLQKSRTYHIKEFVEEVLQKKLIFDAENFKLVIKDMLEFGFTKNQVIGIFGLDFYGFNDFIKGIEIKGRKGNRIILLKDNQFFYYAIDGI